MKILITGITGTLGTAVCERLHIEGTEVVGYSRDEQKQRVFPWRDECTMYIGDVRDRDRLLEAARGCDKIYHFAALKCVDTMEANPEESIKTNVYGTENVLHVQRMLKIEKVLLASTDKACLPINAYGMSKALAERLVLRNPENVVCRYGNVLGSRGSVLQMFIESILAKRAVNITDPKMTRFWITAEDAASFVTHCGVYSKGLRVPDMKASRVVDLAHGVASALNRPIFDIKPIGIRAGEKLHEYLSNEYEGEVIYSLTAPQYTALQLKQMVQSVIGDDYGPDPGL